MKEPEQMKRVIEIAETMLDREIPRSLFNRLDRAQELANMADGQIWSRQVIANIIMTWEVENEIP